MEKEEKKADLQQLLNSLIEKGWEPFGNGGLAPYIEIHGRDISFYKLCDDGMREWVFDTDIRAVLSIDSGLWQFVCENGMVKHEIYEDLHSWTFTTADHSDFWYTSGDNYEYRLIESALKDESELEDFLLNSIKLD